MNPLEDPRVLIVALKGLPTSIAALLCQYQQPVTQAHLCDMLDSSDKTVSKALHRLQEFQILSHSEEGWSVTANVALLGFSPQVGATQKIQAPVDKPVEKGRKFSDPSLSSSTSTSSIKLTSLKLEENLLLDLDPEPEPEPDPEPETEPDGSEKYRECHAAALEAGISEPKATLLAKLPHISVELIEYHVERALSEGQKIGLAIYRIEKNWSIRKAQGRKTQGREDRQKYVTGKYADWINH